MPDKTFRISALRVTPLLQWAAGCLLLAGIESCNSGSGSTQPLDTSTSGTISIAVDESLQPISKALVEGFEGTYNKAKLNVRYCSEAQAIKLLQQDSVRCIITARQLNSSEQAVFDRARLRLRNVHFATDGIALLLHPGNPDSTFALTQLQQVLQGKITQWRQLDEQGAAAPIRIVFDNSSSSTVRYLSDSLLSGQAPRGDAFAARTNPEVVKYVAANPNSLGIIGLPWISDGDDKTANAFLATVKVAALKEDRKVDTADFVRPYQAFLATKEYPLRRALYIVSREARTGLATGFMSYAASDRGQRIILKADLLPATMPLRIVSIGSMNKINR